MKKTLILRRYTINVYTVHIPHIIYTVVTTCRIGMYRPRALRCLDPRDDVIVTQAKFEVTIASSRRIQTPKS